MKMRRYGWLLVLLLAQACSEEPTAVRLTVSYDDAWALTALEVSGTGRTVRVPVMREVLVWLNDPAPSEEITISITGFRDEQRYAFGRVVVRPVKGGEVHATIALTRVPCGAWCSEGARACHGDGVGVCEEQADGCMGWSTPSACPESTPFCSFGVCAAACTDECAQGERRCAGPDGTQDCGQSDSDSCLEWLPVSACGEGESCSFASCLNVCRDECDVGAIACRDSGLASCADRNFDGCTEWGPSEPCDEGQSCERGACRPIGECSDLCTDSACDDATLTQCGNYDLDPCREPSPGVSCMPADACAIGTCAADGCQSAPRVCAEPPAATCLDASTLRTYAGSGSCSAGACEYASTDSVCADGCENGRCVGAGCEPAFFDRSLFGNACFQ